MRKDREENLDYLDEEDTGIEDERQGFSGSPKTYCRCAGLCRADGVDRFGNGGMVHL